MSGSNSTIDRGTNAVADVVVTVVNVLARFLDAVIETAGNILATLLESAGKFLNKVPGISRFLYGFFHWLATIVSAIFDGFAISISATLNFIANGIAGSIRILGGLITAIGTKDISLLRRGLADIASGIAGAVIAIAAKLLALVQSMLFMQMGERPLNTDEKAILKRVYRNSVSLNNIRVIEGFAGLFNVNDRPFTLGNKIYMKKHNSATNPALFVHECCHVWQYHHEGTRYISDALWAQHTFKDAYDWEAEIKRGITRWQDFNKESQAEFIMDLFNLGRRIPSTNIRGEFFDDDPIEANVEFKHRGIDHTDLAAQSVKHIRSKQ